MNGGLWVLGFGYEAVVDAWQDARFAGAIEQVWCAAGRPSEAMAWWMASADEYAFRWYITPAAAQLLDDAKIDWRHFVIGRTPEAPREAHLFTKDGPLGA